MSLTLIVLLRIVHVVAGSFWMGAALANAAFVLPGARAAGPAGGAVMKQIVQVRRLPLFMNLAMSLTLLSGFALLWWASGGFQPAWFATATGIVWSLGSAFAIAAALLGHFVTGPSARRLSQLAGEALASGGPPSEAVQARMLELQQRLFGVARLGAVLLVLSAAAMAAGRYVVA